MLDYLFKNSPTRAKKKKKKRRKKSGDGIQMNKDYTWHRLTFDEVQAQGRKWNDLSESEQQMTHKILGCIGMAIKNGDTHA